MFHRIIVLSFTAVLVVVVAIPSARAQGTKPADPPQANRLAYLDELDPYYVSRTFPKLTTPQWVGEAGVEAVVVLAIDDMRGHEKWEAFLRPILERLKKIDGRAPVSIMTCTIDPQDPHLQTWLNEGLSLEVHTIDHPCPLLKDGDFAKAKSTYDRCVDLLSSVPGSRPVAFRMPCCDSLNTNSPRFYAEIFNKRTPLLPSPAGGEGGEGRRREEPLSPAAVRGAGAGGGNFLQIDSSVFNVFTANDPALPRDLVFDADGRERFRKYVPAGRSFVNTIEDYPYPYVIGRLCWEFPCVTPSDWQAQNLRKPNNPITVADLKAALDATVIKQGVFNFVFHPHGWIQAEQVVELIDHAVAKHGGKVKFLTFREALERLNKNLLRGQPLRAPNGQDNGVRLVDLDGDGLIDVVVGNEHVQETRQWLPDKKRWFARRFPVRLVDVAEKGERRDTGVRFSSTTEGRLANHIRLSVITRNEQVAGEWYFQPGPSVHNQGWTPLSEALRGLDWDGRPVFTVRAGRDPGVRLRDIDHDGVCELIMSDAVAGQQAIFGWSAQARRWSPLPFRLPDGSTFVDWSGRDAGLRFIDLNGDGYDDVIFSNEERYSIHLFESMQSGWSREVCSGKRGDKPPEQEIPPIVRDDGTNNGFWVHSRQLWWQNEDTAKLPNLVARRSFDELVKDVQPGPQSPEVSLRSMQPRPGFDVELVAAEPLVMDPIAFAWGPDGKLWVVEMGDYPLGVDGKGKHGGIVRFLEDTDGDGRYDKSTVFLDGLGFPTGVMPWRNGVLVTCAPEIFYAEDTDGDGRADVRRTLFSGFAEGNQQHRVNGLVWGLDNWVYGANGDSGGGIKSHVSSGWYEKIRSPRTRGGGEGQGEGARGGTEPISINGRDFRIRPDDGLIEPETGQSQFGRCRDDWGNWFGCNNSNPMYQFVLADQYIRRNQHVAPPDPRVPVSVVPGAAPVYPISRTLERFNDPNAANRFTSANSVIVYRDELFGPEFAGNSFVSEPVHNLVHREVMSPRGVTFTSRRAADEQQSEFLASRDNWFRPATIQTGPDGALWVADMYRHVIEHPEWIPKDWQQRLDLRAGHDKGRIYRVFPTGKRPRPVPRLDRLDAPGLVAALDSPNGWQRDMAQMLLVWRQDKAAVEPLEILAAECDRPTGRLHALCALDGLDALHEDVLLKALADPHPGVRRHAVRLSEMRLADSKPLAAAIVKLVADSDPQVRLQLAYSLGEWDDAKAGQALGALAVRDAADPFITAAVLSSATRNLDEILAAVFADVGPAPDLIEKFLSLALAQQNAKAVARVLDLIASRTSGANRGQYVTWQFAVLAGLLDTLDRRSTSLDDFREGADDQLRSSIDRLANLFAAARTLARDADRPVSERTTAVRLLGRRADHRADDLATLAELLSPQTPGELQNAAVAGTGRLRDPHVPDMLLKSWRGHGPALRSAVLDVLLAREPFVKVLLDQIESARVPAAELDAVHRQRLLEHPSQSVRERASKLLAGSTSSSREQVLQEYRPVLKLTGDRQRGEAVFRKSCSICHKLAGNGHEVGPDLSGLSDRSPERMLIAMLDPNRAVEARYLSYVAATTDGRVFTGMLASETGASITLLAQEGKREVILRKDLEALQSSGKSLMPEGIEKDIPSQDMADLLAYLAATGPPRKTFDGNKPELVRPEALRGELYLLATASEIYGSTLVFEPQFQNLGYWSSEDDHAVWSFELTRPGKYAVWLEWACHDSTAGNSFVLQVGDQQVTGKVPGTGTWETYKRAKFGELTLEPGPHRLLFRSSGKVSGALVDLRGIKLAPPAK